MNDTAENRRKRLEAVEQGLKLGTGLFVFLRDFTLYVRVPKPLQMWLIHMRSLDELKPFPLIRQAVYLQHAA